MNQMQREEKERRGSCPEGETSAPAFPLISLFLCFPFASRTLFVSPSSRAMFSYSRCCCCCCCFCHYCFLSVGLLSFSLSMNHQHHDHHHHTVSRSRARSSVGEKSGCFSLCFTCGLLSMSASLCVWSAAGEKFLKHSLILQTCLIYESPYCLLFLWWMICLFSLSHSSPFAPSPATMTSLSLVQKRVWIPLSFSRTSQES